MIRKKRRKKQYTRERIVANFRIRYPEVRVLTEKGDVVGIMPTREALYKAQQEEKDLVLITAKAKPPVVKIIELSKYKYQAKQKKAKDRKKNRKQDLKELRFSIFMGDNDLQSRIKKIKKFLEKGDKVKLTLLFKGRQIMKKDLAYNLFAKIFEETKELAEIEIEPKIIGKKMIAQISPIKKSS